MGYNKPTPSEIEDFDARFYMRDFVFEVIEEKQGGVEFKELCLAVMRKSRADALPAPLYGMSRQVLKTGPFLGLLRWMERRGEIKVETTNDGRKVWRLV